MLTAGHPQVEISGKGGSPAWSRHRKPTRPHAADANRMYTTRVSRSCDAVELCVETLGEVVSLLARDDVGPVEADRGELARALLPTVLRIATTMMKDRNKEEGISSDDPLLRKLICVLLDMVRQMSEEQYMVVMKSLDSKSSGKANTLLTDALAFMMALLQRPVFRPHWADMLHLQHYVMLHALRLLSTTLRDQLSSIEDLELDMSPIHATLQDWFNTLGAVASSPPIQLETLPTSRRQRATMLYGDIRRKAASLLADMWFSLEDHKRYFIPHLVGTFLEVSFLRDEEVRNTIIPLFFDMMQTEYKYTSEIDPSRVGNMRTFENALIDKLDVLAEAGRGDAAWRARFVTLCGALASAACLPGGAELVAAAARQLDALLQYRAAPAPHRLYLVSGVLDFYKQIERPHMYIRYVHRLAALHAAAGHMAEAGLTLKLHAKLLEWSDIPLPPRLRHPSAPDHVTHFDLKAALVKPRNPSLRVAGANNNFYMNQTLFFDKLSSAHLIRDEWKLVVYFDMEPYWQGNKLLNKYINQLEENYNNSSLPFPYKSIIVQLQHGYNEIEHYNKLLSSQQFPRERVRSRRGLINAVGNIAHSLFGVLDDQFAIKYEQDIDIIRKNQNHLALLWKNQTSIIESEYNILKRMEDSIDKQHKMFYHYVNEQNKVTTALKNQVTISNEFFLFALAANNLLTRLKGVQEVLLDTITEIYYGKFNIHLLKPEQLMDELHLISAKVSKDLTLPIDIVQTELPKIYQLLKVKTKMTTKYFIFEVKLPLVSRDIYEIYKIIPIPRKVNNNMVTLVPVSNYIAINVRKDSFMTMSSLDLQECKQFDTKTQLCPINNLIQHMQNENSLCLKDDQKSCKTKLEPCQDSWTRLYELNTFIFFLCKSRTINAICEDQITSGQLIDSGIIVLKADCLIKGGEFTIFTQKRLFNELTIAPDLEKIVIPPINRILNPTLPSIILGSENISGHEKELDNLKNQINKIKADAPLINEISHHDVHHYVVIYLLVSAVGAAAVAFGVRRYRSRSNCELRTPPPAPATRRDGLRGLTNAACQYSASDHSVNIKGQNSVSDQCVDKSSASVTRPNLSKHSPKCVDSNTSPIFNKINFKIEP
ncbi:unnamed protein product [Euphydryas editha]|uniref:Dedicator of cytokinesis TPR repeats region domain-containing protein n=1 Tax=Euphydryas editha TaxID=104508 RepID=A0AAU9UHD4_EUPED|nr:unnamed protein product [Euphydryas editha]